MFVETNWLVNYAAPAHRKLNAAIELLEKAERGEVRLYLPSICLAECRRPIQKLLARSDANNIRDYLRWAKRRGEVDDATDEAVRRTLERMENEVRRGIDQLPDVLSDLQTRNGVEVFHLSERMLERCTELFDIGLQPFDQAILAAILVKADLLRETGVERFAFCELDSDLQPWDKKSDPIDPLVSLYDNAKIWVYGDFLLEEPAMPEGWGLADARS